MRIEVTSSLRVGLIASKLLFLISCRLGIIFASIYVLTKYYEGTTQASRTSYILVHAQGCAFIFLCSLLLFCSLVINPITLW